MKTIKTMKANVLVYLTNGNVVRMHVQHPEVSSCENSTHVGIFDHLCWQYAPDEYNDWYEEVILYWTTEVACIYVDNKCAWHNPVYIKDNTSIKKFLKEYVKGRVDYND